MNARNDPCNTQGMDTRQLYEQLAWRNQRADQDQAMNFDEWLDSPEGRAWLDGEAERYAPTSCDYGYYWEKSL